MRTKQGGGTRKITINRMATKEDILREALNLFFRDGMSQKGSKEDFDFDVWDFAETPLQPNITPYFLELLKSLVSPTYFYLC